MDIGLKIKTARQEKGLTQEELGNILGVQKSAIAKYESGRVVNIKRSTLKKISDVLGIPPFELIFDEHKEASDADNEIPDTVKQLVELAMSVPENKAELALKLLRAIVEDDH